ncbi:hypothetical protein [Paraburkholderia kururiensis]|uniref:hypothetical protein n=1 Tax=Paraburkholderia kururiensis TaxID=984307 RepID=UPI0039A4FA75
MQESHVSEIADDNEKGVPAASLRLSGEFSEWLFATGFWRGVNAKCGTMFDQYEEDEATATMAQLIAASLGDKARELGSFGEGTVEFIRGWTAAGAPLKASVSKHGLLAELIQLQELLTGAAERGHRVRFSL